MRAMLSKMGYFEVVTAEDGEQVVSPLRGANRLFYLPCFVPEAAGFRRAQVRIKVLKKAI
jgi:hypothetical protein